MMHLMMIKSIMTRICLRNNKYTIQINIVHNKHSYINVTEEHLKNNLDFGVQLDMRRYFQTLSGKNVKITGHFSVINYMLFKMRLVSLHTNFWVSKNLKPDFQFKIEFKSG